MLCARLASKKSYLKFRAARIAYGVLRNRKDPERHAKYNREYRAKYPEKIKTQARARYKRDKLKIACRSKTFLAIKSGILTRQKCVKCGCENMEKIEAHHEDYTKPLEIIWLCTTCHGKQHSTIYCSMFSDLPS